jgi:hypothetical protein
VVTINASLAGEMALIKPTSIPAGQSIKYIENLNLLMQKPNFAYSF